MDTLLSSVKSKPGLDDKLYSSITNIILNGSLADKKKHFAFFTSLTISAKPTPQVLISGLLLYIMDIHKDFKAELLSFLKKNVQGVLELFESFFSIVDTSLLTVNKDVGSLTSKAILLNNLYDFYRKVLAKESIEEHANGFIHMQFLKEFHLFFTGGDLLFLIMNINDETELVLSFMFNCFSSLIKTMNTQDSDSYSKLEDIKTGFECLMTTKRVAYKKIYKDYFYNFSSIFYWLLKLKCKDDLSKYISSAIEFLNCFIKEHEVLLIYAKSMLANIALPDDKAQEQLLSLSFDCFKEMIQTEIISEHTSIDYPQSITMMSFYKFFLETNWYHNYSLLINDTFIVFLQKITHPSPSLIASISEANLIPSLFSKIKQEKDNIGFIEDNYFLILEQFITINKDYSPSISQAVEAYIKQLISSNSRTSINECALFSFLIEDSLSTRKDYLLYLLSLPFEKRLIQHICEYSKLFFDYCIRVKKDDQVFLSAYPAPFLKFLSAIHIRDMKYLNNLFVNFEKSNSVYLQLLISYIHSINSRSYSLLLTLLKPYKAQKKLLLASEEAICFRNESLGIDIALSIEELKAIAKSTDYSLILLLAEFLNEFENCNQIFPIFKTVLKYNIKSSYAEYKSGIMKSITVFFNFYFIKVTKLMNKAKKSPEEGAYISKALDNFTYTIFYVIDNIYDRPVESLLPFIEIAKLMMANSDKLIEQATKKDLIADYATSYYKVVFNKGLCSGLIGLLNHSWYFVRANTFDILKHVKYEPIINEMKEELIKETDKHLFSLRQMDSEGSAYLFLVLLHHMKKEFLLNYLTQKLNYSLIEVNSMQNDVSASALLCQSIECFNELIIQRIPEYLAILSKPKDDNAFDIKAQSIHSFYILTQVLLSLEKSSLAITEETIGLLMKVARQILNLNGDFSKYLINNGVSEFSTENIEENDQYNNNEDKRLISLWCVSKYSLETLSIILDLLTTHYCTLLSLPSFEEKILKPITSILYQLITLIIASKHMGVVFSLSDCLYKAAVILMKSNETHKAYRSIPLEQIKLFIETKLIKEEVSSTLRRSAGIPFLIVSLIRSHISIQIASQTITEILQYAITSLLDSYSKYQFSTPDVSVHSLHIIRLISDDTHLKPYMRDLNDIIILRIIDGLQSENWSIKNACMLMLSRVIKSNFALGGNEARTLPTFVVYFSTNPGFLTQIKQILMKNAEGIEVNDCILLFITFFTKFRETKPCEYCHKDLNELIEVVMRLGKKNSKLFRKLLSAAIDKMIGGNTIKLKEKIAMHIVDVDLSKEEGNNLLDFYYNMIVSLINRSASESKDVIMKCIEVVKAHWTQSNYFAKTKLLQMIEKFNRKVTDDSISIPSDLLRFNDIGVKVEDKAIDMTRLFDMLTQNNRKFYYYQFIKHSISLYVKLGYQFHNLNLLSLLFNLKAEELVVHLFKAFPRQLSLILPLNQLISEIVSASLLSKVSVNISSRIAVYLLQNCNELPLDQGSQLISSLIVTVKEERAKSKLISRLLPLIGSLISANPKQLLSKDSTLLFEVIYDYSFGHHMEKIRIEDVKCLEKLLCCYSALAVDNTVLLKTLFIFLNDENPEIRLVASRLALVFNHSTGKLLLKAKEDVHYSNEYIVKQLLKKNVGSLAMNKKLQIEFKQFIEFVFEEDFYFNESKASFNKSTKVFYFEPDNKYIDNIESKLIIAQSQSQTEGDSPIEIQKEPLPDSLPLFVPIEQFTLHIKHHLAHQLRSGHLKASRPQFLFNHMRSLIFAPNQTKP